MALLSRDIAGYVDPGDVADWVKSMAIGGYLCTIVAAVLVYDAGEKCFAGHFGVPDAAFDSLHV